MNFDLFAPQEDEVPAPSPPPAKPAPEPRQDRAWTSPRLAPDQPCRFPLGRGAFRCGVGGGAASGSMDSGRTWFCHEHRPWGYLPSERDPEDARRWGD